MKYMGLELEQWQMDRLALYKGSGALDFIKNYFDVKQGVRCIAGHYIDYPNSSPRYWEHNGNNCRMMTLPDVGSGKWSALIDFNCVHSFMHIFDKSVLEWMPYESRIETAEDSIIGMCAVLDIDTPYESNDEFAKRLDFFDFIPQFNNVISVVDSELEELGEEYNILFSGNGLKIEFAGFYGDDWEDYEEDFLDLIDKLKDECGLGDPLKVHVDNNQAPWNDYFKCPFTFHEIRNCNIKKHRISMPVAKGEIDAEWLEYVSDVNTVMNNYNVIEEIIKRARWEKLW